MVHSDACARQYDVNIRREGYHLMFASKAERVIVLAATTTEHLGSRTLLDVVLNGRLQCFWFIGSQPDGGAILLLNFNSIQPGDSI